MADISKGPGRKYYRAIYYDRDGVRRFKSTKCTGARAAQAAADRFEREAQGAADPAENQAPLSEILDDLVDHIESEVNATPPKRSRATLRMHRVKAGHVKRIFGADFRVSGLEAKHVDRYIAQRRRETACENTIAKELVTFRSAMRLAKRAGKWCGDLEAIFPIAFAPEYKPRERWADPDELRTLIGRLTTDHAARAAYMVATSANWGESTRARRTDESRYGVLVHGTKRTSRRRVVPIVADWQRTLLDFALEHGQGSGELLFASGYEGFHDALERACNEAPELKHVTSNDLRRTFCQWMRASGVPAELVAPAMGHADTKMVEKIYGRMAPEVLGARIAQVLGIAGTAVAQTGADQMDRMDGWRSESAPNPSKSGAGDPTRTGTPLRAGDFKSGGKPLPSPREYKRKRSYKTGAGTTVAQHSAGVVIVLPRVRGAR